MSKDRIRTVRVEEPLGGGTVTQPVLAAPVKPSSVEWLFPPVAALLALWIFATSINLARIGWIPLPISDDWDRWITYVSDHFSLAWLWHQHVDHRLVFPKILFEIDTSLFQGRGWFLLVCAFGLQLLTGILLWRMAGGVCRQDRRERLILAAAIFACLFSAQQWFNFVMPFQVQFPLVYCSAIAAVYFLWKAAERERARPLWIAATIAAMTVATYSMANGVMLWPVLLVAAYWLRLPWRYIAALAAGAVLLGAPFFYHFYPSAEPIYQLAGGERVWRTLVFWLGHLGSPMFPLAMFSDDENVRITTAVIPGCLLALALAAEFALLWIRRRQYSSARALLVFYAGFLVVSSATMAYGRAGTSLQEIFTPRYLTPSYIFWASMLLVLWPHLAQRRRRFHRAWLYALVCAAIFVVIAMHQRTTVNNVRNWRQTIELPKLAVVNNVTDPTQWINLYHSAEMAAPAVDYLRNNRLAIFSEEWTHWPGIPLNRRFFIDRNPDACQGQFEEAVFVSSPLRPGWRTAGWAWDVKAGRPPRYVVLADDQGRVAGVALTGFPQPAAYNALAQQYLASPWKGYVSGEPRPITAYAVEADERSLCPIGTRPLRRASRELDLTELGAPLPDAAPESAGAWSKDGYYQGHGGPGAPSIGGPVYGSYPDANTGTLRLGPFHLDGHTEIAIPIATGPDTQHLSVVVRDAATKEVIDKLDPPSIHVSWFAWHPELPLDREITVEVVAEDKGADWGQWLALGWPHTLKQ